MNMPLFNYRSAETIVLRDYQETMVNLSRESIYKHNKIILQAPCGAGKTVLSAYMIKQASEKGLRCAFICDRLSLIDQTSEMFSKYGISHGVIQGDHPLYFPDESVQVCSIQTLARRAVKAFDFVIIDECHTKFKTHEFFLAQTKFALGLSATPWSKGLGKHYHDLVNPVTTKELMDWGYLSNYTGYGPGTIDMTGAKVRAGDYTSEDLEERADTKKIVGDIVKHWVKHAKGRKTIAFCVNTGHANHIAKEFNRVGVKAKSINCYMKLNKETDEVKEALLDFDHGEIDVLCSVDMVSKGFDQPDVDCLILARPTKSVMLHVQQIGRGLRIGGAEKCLILDHAGNIERLGYVEDININWLDCSDKKEKSKKSKESEEKLPKPCTSCDYLKPVGVHKCPACGYEPENIQEIEAIDEELQELKRKKVARKDYTVDDKQKFLAGLNGYARDKGFSKHWKGFYGWALHK